jgi:mannose-6-phosphate isomerase
LDCQRNLSVQVHPNDAAAACLTPPDLGKTEAWVVLDAQPGSRIYAGLRTGCDEATLRRALGDDSIEKYLHSFEPKAGDCVFIPAGTVHALGAGLLVAEIQQASDTTYRLYDWGRTGPDRKPRPLHVEEALAVIDYSAVEIGPCRSRQTPRTSIECLVSCDKFIVNRWTLGSDERLPGDNRFHILSVLDGALDVLAGERNVRVSLGQTVLLPACDSEAMLRPQLRSTALLMHLP